MGVFSSEPDFHNRPEWGVFDYIFSDCCSLSVESRIIDFDGRKTGLFKPVWLADLIFYGLLDVSQHKRVTARGGSCPVCGLEKAAWIDRPADHVFFSPLTFTAVTASYPANPSLLVSPVNYSSFF